MPSYGAQQLEAALLPPPLTAARIARECGVSPQAVWKWRAGIAKPSMKHRELLFVIARIPVEAWEESARGEAVPS